MAFAAQSATTNALNICSAFVEISLWSTHYCLHTTINLTSTCTYHYVKRSWDVQVCVDMWLQRKALARIYRRYPPTELWGLLNVATTRSHRWVEWYAGCRVVGGAVALQSHDTNNDLLQIVTVSCQTETYLSHSAMAQLLECEKNLIKHKFKCAAYFIPSPLQHHTWCALQLSSVSRVS